MAKKKDKFNWVLLFESCVLGLIFTLAATYTMKVAQDIFITTKTFIILWLVFASCNSVYIQFKEEDK